LLEVIDVLSAFRAESAQGKDDQADQQNQANPAAADGWTSEVKPAAAEQKEQDNHKQ
jgi:hypothetical protein